MIDGGGKTSEQSPRSDVESTDAWILTRQRSLPGVLVLQIDCQVGLSGLRGQRLTKEEEFGRIEGATEFEGRDEPGGQASWEVLERLKSKEPSPSKRTGVQSW